MIRKGNARYMQAFASTEKLVGPSGLEPEFQASEA